MEKKSVLKGVVFVGLGASFFGMLATFVKLAYNEGYTTAEVTTAQVVIGVVGLFILSVGQTLLSKKKLAVPTRSDIWKLLLSGTSLGLTSLFYYLSVQYINVSIAIVLLMQSVWISVVVEGFLNNKFPNARKIIATIIVLFGTVLATNALGSEIRLDWRGVAWGLMAAASYTVAMLSSNKIATYVPALRKSFIMVLGSTIVVLLFLLFAQVGPVYSDTLARLYYYFSDNTANISTFHFSILWKYGLFMGLFGMIIPPIFYNIGFPNTGLGLGSIVSSLELPVSVTMAFILLSEKVILVQWMGIVLILLAIVLMNLPKKGQSFA